jgi:hypothetical protein
MRRESRWALRLAIDGLNGSSGNRWTINLVRRRRRRRRRGGGDGGSVLVGVMVVVYNAVLVCEDTRSFTEQEQRRYGFRDVRKKCFFVDRNWRWMDVLSEMVEVGCVRTLPGHLAGWQWWWGHG